MASGEAYCATYIFCICTYSNYLVRDAVYSIFSYAQKLVPCKDNGSLHVFSLGSTVMYGPTAWMEMWVWCS